MPTSRSKSESYIKKKTKCYQALGKVIRTLRKERGMTIAQFAEFCDFSDRHIAQIERAERQIPIYSLHEVAEILGVKASDILRDSGF